MAVIRGLAKEAHVLQVKVRPGPLLPFLSSLRQDLMANIMGHQGA